MHLRVSAVSHAFNQSMFVFFLSLSHFMFAFYFSLDDNLIVPNAKTMKRRKIYKMKNIAILVSRFSAAHQTTKSKIEKKREVKINFSRPRSMCQFLLNECVTSRLSDINYCRDSDADWNTYLFYLYLYICVAWYYFYRSRIFLLFFFFVNRKSKTTHRAKVRIATMK